MNRTYTYNDIYIDLGEIGEHELLITAININGPFEKPKLLIKKAVAFVRIDDQPMVQLDVTGIVSRSSEWNEIVTKDFMDALNKDWHDDAEVG